MMKTAVTALAIAVGTMSMAGSAQALSVTIDSGLEIAGVSGFPIDPAPGPLAPGWVGFNAGPPGSTSVGTTTVNPLAGLYAAELSANAGSGQAASAVLKNANLGIGIVEPNSTIMVSFWARGASVNGGVAFAEFFSERPSPPGGTSSSTILGGGPIALNPDPNVWTQFTYNHFGGSDVGGGVTLQFVAVAGAVQGSASQLFVDNISVRPAVIPLPMTGLMLATALGALGFARRRRSA